MYCSRLEETEPAVRRALPERRGLPLASRLLLRHAGAVVRRAGPGLFRCCVVSLLPHSSGCRCKEEEVLISRVGYRGQALPAAALFRVPFRGYGQALTSVAPL